MSMRTSYNEHKRYAAQWLRPLTAVHIAPGEVDARDIHEVIGRDADDDTE